jgi:hypothetical protein
MCATDPDVLGDAVGRAVDLVVAAPDARRDRWLVRAVDRWRRADEAIAPTAAAMGSDEPADALEVAV